MANSAANTLPELSFTICHPIARIQSNPLHSRITEIALAISGPFDFSRPNFFVHATRLYAFPLKFSPLSSCFLIIITPFILNLMTNLFITVFLFFKID